MWLAELEKIEANKSNENEIVPESIEINTDTTTMANTPSDEKENYAPLKVICCIVCIVISICLWNKGSDLREEKVYIEQIYRQGYISNKKYAYVLEQTNDDLMSECYIPTAIGSICALAFACSAYKDINKNGQDTKDDNSNNESNNTNDEQ